MHSNRICRALVRRRGKLGERSPGDWSRAAVCALGRACECPRTSGAFLELVVYPSVWIGRYSACSIHRRRFGLSISDKNRAAAMERVCASVFLGGRIVSDERTDQTIRLVSAELGICGVVVRDNPAFHVQREIVLDDCGAASGEPV